MRWFCVAFASWVVVSTALTQAGSPVDRGGAKSVAPVPPMVMIESTTTRPFEVAELSNGRQVNEGAAWSVVLFLGLPFLIRRRRERLS